MGLAGFYQRFIKEYSRMTAPITDLLTKENKRFTWTKEAEDGFRELKAVLTSAPILGNPDFSKLFTIESDASDRAVGAALVQEQDGVTRVISYFSKKLNRTQRRYSAEDKECLGVLSAIQHFRHYVEGAKFRVITDARSLLWLFNVGAETGNAKLLRWALRIQAYDFDLEYRKGKANITADCLSRSIEVDAVRVTLPDDEYEEQIENITGNPTKFVSDGREYSWIRDNYEPNDDDKNVPEQKKKLFEEIKTNLTAAYQRHAKTYNLRTNANCPKYTVGEKVLKQTFDLSDKGKGFCKKLAPKYEPAVVRKVLGKNTYELEDLDGKRFGVYFTNRLKKWHTPQPAASGS
ncbi:hypothetical protein quinque_002520 [Culex quinquefasciatus]